jgi:choline kinase
MRAIILAAGRATRFDGKLKSQLILNGETIIGRLVRQLKSCNVKPIYVVVGFQSEKFLEVPDVVLINDPLYYTADNARSLKVALDRIGFDDTIMLDGDMVLSEDLLPKLVNSYKGESMSLVDLRTTEPEAMKLVIANGYIVRFSKEEGEGAEICEIVDSERLKKIYSDLNSVRWWGTGPNATYFRIVEVNSDSIWMDVDTPEEYEKVKEIFKASCFLR